MTFKATVSLMSGCRVVSDAALHPLTFSSVQALLLIMSPQKMDLIMAAACERFEIFSVS